MATWRAPETLTWNFHNELSVRRSSYRFIGQTELFVSKLSLGMSASLYRPVQGQSPFLKQTDMATWRAPETLTWNFHNELSVRRSSYRFIGQTELFVSKLSLGMSASLSRPVQGQSPFLKQTDMATWRAPETLTWNFHNELSVRRSSYRFIGQTELFVSKLSLGMSASLSRPVQGQSPFLKQTDMATWRAPETLTWNFHNELSVRRSSYRFIGQTELFVSKLSLGMSASLYRPVQGQSPFLKQTDMATWRAPETLTWNFHNELSVRRSSYRFIGQTELFVSKLSLGMSASLSRPVQGQSPFLKQTDMATWRAPETLTWNFHNELSVRRSSYRFIGQTELFVSKLSLGMSASLSRPVQGQSPFLKQTDMATWRAPETLTWNFHNELSVRRSSYRFIGQTELFVSKLSLGMSASLYRPVQGQSPFLKQTDMATWRAPETLTWNFHNELSVRRSSYRFIGQTELFVSKLSLGMSASLSRPVQGQSPFLKQTDMATWRAPETLTWNFHNELSVRRSSYRFIGQTELFVSKLSLGGGPFGDLYGRTENAEAVVKEALVNGINFIDTAYWKGLVRSEEVLGRVLRKIPRKAYYITTKVGRQEADYGRMVELRGDRIVEAVEGSLRRLGLDHIDVLQLQLNDPDFETCLPRLLSETLPALHCARYAGKVRYLAIAGYSLDHLKTMVDLSPVPLDAVVSYARGYMGDTSLTNYIPYFRASEVSIERLSASYALNLPNVDTTLSGMSTPAESSNETYCLSCMKQVRENLSTAWFALSPHEFRVRETILRRFLHPLNNANWEHNLREQFRKKTPRRKPIPPK